MKDWVRVAAKLGFALTEPGVRSAFGDRVKDRVGSVSSTIADKYEDTVERLEAARGALQGRTPYWPSRMMGFLLGIGVGAGLGILLAPASGTETREAIRGKAAGVKNRVVESAAMAGDNIRQSVATMPPTGTEG